MDIKINKDSIIVFDLDDTLYNEVEYLKSAYHYIASYLENENWKSLYTTMFSIYRNKQNVFNFLAQKYPITFNELIDMYRNHEPNIYLFDGAMDVINAIKVKKGKLAIITDGRQKTQATKIKALGIESFFNKIIISEVIGTEKPHIANYKAIENEFPNSEYYYIADNCKKDFVTPNAIGWKTIGLIDNGLNIHSNSYEYASKEYNPQYYIESYKELNII